MLTIAVDLMGGDKAPEGIIQGVFEAAEQLDVAIALVGTKEALAQNLGHNGGLARSGTAPGDSRRITPVEASQVVTMGDSPTEVWRAKPDSSISVGIKLVKEGRADAFVSAGNSGAVAAASVLLLETMQGIERPAIATLYRTQAGSTALLLDIGANVDCRPRYLLQFGQMGSAYMSKVYRMQSPRVALLSNGEEESKGTKLVKDAHKLLKESGLNFIGNVEGFDLVRGAADVIVTDGFTGNVVLKLAESLTEAIFLSMKDALGSKPLAMMTKMLWGPPVRSVVRQWDTSDIGGAPLLGVNGNIVIAHGRAGPVEIKGAIGLAQRMAQGNWAAALTTEPVPGPAVSSGQ